jgi:deazaflavin-dependent oxidoreductase (nitroreductase family)
MSQQPGSPTRYIAPTSRGEVLFMKAVRWLTEHGVSLLGSRVLTVRGRRTGTPQSVPVNLLTLAGDRYLVAPRGNTQWVRNVRAAGEAQLRVGRRVEQVRLDEVPPSERGPGPPRLPAAVGLGGRPVRRRPVQAVHGRRACGRRTGYAGFPVDDGSATTMTM